MNLFENPAGEVDRVELPADVAACLRRGGVVVSGNHRAARALRAAHAAHQRRLGLEAWLTPRIFDWEGWTSSLWHEYLLHSAGAPLLLTPLQERSIWKRVARGQGEGLLVVSPDGMAEQAQQAYGLLSAYNSHAERNRSWEYAGLGDAEAFRRWSLAFDQECRKNRWASRGALEALLAECVESGGIQMPSEILLTGFDRLTPRQDVFLGKMQSAGVVVNQAAGAGDALAVQLIVARDLRDEIAACAWWIRRRLEPRSNQRIAVIAQDVNSLRGEISRVFRQVLLPRSLGIEAAPDSLPFEFSLGTSLAAVPVVKAALLLARWLCDSLLEEEVSWLMLSGFLWDSTTGAGASSLAQLDAEFRRWGGLQPEIGLETWLRKLGKMRSPAAPRLREQLRSTLDAAVANGIRQRTRTCSEWVDVAQGVLQRAGWSATGSDSVEFQARKRWERVLDEVSAMAFDGSRVEYREFVTVLERHAEETIFSPESHDAPVQIMGPLESAGQSFDAVWFLGADDTQWPQPSGPHSLLPLAIQRKARMPHSTPEVDWQLASDITRRLAGSAEECIFSYAAQNNEGPLRPSPLLAVVASPSQASSSRELLTALNVEETPQILRAVEEVDTSVVPWPVVLPAGGARILKMQAACPFQSFATRRLDARELNRAEWGLTPIDRGNVLHTVLEGVWSADTEPGWRLSTRADLVTASATFRLDAILEHHIDAALAKWADPGDPWMQAYLRSEKLRLLTLLRQWFAREALRQDFSVLATEKKLPDVAVGNLKLNLRVDRVDQLSDGGHLLLDYKSGEVGTSQWLGARPDEPQLPLYAAYGGIDDLRGILFAQIRAGSVDFVGHVDDAANLFDASLAKTSPLLKFPFDASMLNRWTSALRSLADEFLRGEAAVAPKLYPKTCEFCPLSSLCRVRETSIPESAASGDPEAETDEMFVPGEQQALNFEASRD